MAKSPSLVFNASRMARMVGGLSSSVIASSKSREKRRSQHMLQSKSGHELGAKRRAMAAVEANNDYHLNGGVQGDAAMQQFGQHDSKTHADSINSAQHLSAQSSTTQV